MDVIHISTAGRKEREKERRRSEIIDAAEQLFSDKGFDGVSMDDVAKATDLARGTLYLYFINKESLYYAVVARGAVVLNEMFRDGIGKGRTGAEKLLSTGMAFYEFSQKYPEYYEMFVTAQSPCFTLQDDNSDLIASAGQENFQIVCECIVEGIADGSLRHDIDPVKTACFLMLSTQIIVHQTPSLGAALAIKGDSHREFVKYSLDLMMKSITTETRRN